ncbi:Taurine catabolism dioxygenase TauD/TfdA [marine gamma proteobacterium HTCC2143]|jgi:alpha-ketoglutarate-dependent taurine dioxygenase|uniref:Taurine catabolism dioxygenase TauD/TfdA n=1 Tax=marine gamma proteobacterium HTCC2143 TaxID=247633 RepID=A0Y8D7_9GAMM|nr:Taurine catabolism dioxygenase TauD/TfdA [marine gamma proteobacterium HTCC2143]|tara:strand:+ start:1021 stop:1890 length:870 start_codon:yes stop_codon:yes gene_type:complete
MEELSHFSLKPLANKTFGAIVTDIRLNELDNRQFSALYQAWLEYGLLIFPGQYLSDAEQQTFAARFGDLIKGVEAVELSNVLPNGSLRDAPDDDMMKIIRGNMHWHQDNTYMPVQAKGAVFSAKVVPQAQGDTGFADMRAAWDALDGGRRNQVAGLSAYHSLVHSQKLVGEETKSVDSEYIGYGLDIDDTPLRPLLKIHPETGRKSLAIGRHAFGIPEMSEGESSKFLADLMDFATGDPQRTYQYQWTKGDAVVWDNRCLLHRACSWDYSEPRVMLHSRIAGDPETESA